MAHTLDTFQQNNLTAVNPATFTKTCGSGSTGLILHLIVVGATARTGGTPTYNGIELEQIDTVRTATETNVEMWFLQNPPTGSAYTISIPNTNTRTIRAFTTSIKAQAGYTSIPDVSFGNTGTAANPSDWAAIVVAFKEVQVITDLQTLNVGQSISPEINLPASASVYRYEALRRNWPSTGGDVISITVEISLDGGLTWPYRYAGTYVGGNWTSEDGKTGHRSGLMFSLPDIGNGNRKVRVTKNVLSTLTTVDIMEVS